jgi:hypothetical protein
VGENDRLSPAERFRIAMELFEAGIELKRQNLLREFPDASAEEIDERFYRWLHHRPGAEHGDCSGRPLRWPLEPR